MVPSDFETGTEDRAQIELFEDARGLRGVIEGEARAAEAARTLTPKQVEALRDARLVRAFLPEELGGLEVSLPTLVELVAEVSRSDGAVGWCFGMNGVIGSICSAHLSDAGLERVYGDADPSRVLLAGGFPPMGRAIRDGDGYRVSGHFRFGSGIRHADHVVCTALELADGAPILRGPAALPRAT